MSNKELKEIQSAILSCLLEKKLKII